MSSPLTIPGNNNFKPCWACADFCFIHSFWAWTPSEASISEILTSAFCLNPSSLLSLLIFHLLQIPVFSPFSSLSLPDFLSHNRAHVTPCFFLVLIFFSISICIWGVFFFFCSFCFLFLSNQKPIRTDFKHASPTRACLCGLCDVFLGTSVNGCPALLLSQIHCQTATLVGPAVPHCMLGSVCVSKLKFLQHQTVVALAGELLSCASLCMHFLYSAESLMVSSVWQVIQKCCSCRKER